MPDRKSTISDTIVVGLIGLTLLDIARADVIVPHVDPDQPAPTAVARADWSTTVSAVRFAAYHMPILPAGE